MKKNNLSTGTKLTNVSFILCDQNDVIIKAHYLDQGYQIYNIL